MRAPKKTYVGAAVFLNGQPMMDGLRTQACGQLTDTHRVRLMTTVPVNDLLAQDVHLCRLDDVKNKSQMATN